MGYIYGNLVDESEYNDITTKNEERTYLFLYFLK